MNRSKILFFLRRRRAGRVAGVVAVGRGAHPGRGVRQAEPPRCDYDPDEHPGLPGLPGRRRYGRTAAAGCDGRALGREPPAVGFRRRRRPGTAARALRGVAFCEDGRPCTLAVVVCGDLSRNPGASGDWWVMDASAASENLLLAAHALGLGAVWTGVYPRDERVEAVRRVLGASRRCRPAEPDSGGLSCGQSGTQAEVESGQRPV